MTESQKRIIGLLTDFGSRGGHYIASMKGVILNINPNALIIDISHDVASYSIIEASYILNSAYKYFPEHTVFIAVIDPGVGSSREILAIKTKSNYYFVGPNNGIFFSSLSKEEISKSVIVNNEVYYNKPISKTFHGRDIMSPIGAYITKGISLDKFGPSFDLNNLKKATLKLEIKTHERVIHCIVQFIDSFGNVTTNIAVNDGMIKDTSLSFRDTIELEFKNQNHKGKFVSHFASAPLQSLLFLVGSSGYLEISKNQGNAAKDLDLKVGDIVIIRI